MFFTVISNTGGYDIIKLLTAWLVFLSPFLCSDTWTLSLMKKITHPFTFVCFVALTVLYFLILSTKYKFHSPKSFFFKKTRIRLLKYQCSSNSSIILSSSHNTHFASNGKKPSLGASITYILHIIIMKKSFFLNVNIAFITTNKLNADPK